MRSCHRGWLATPQAYERGKRGSHPSSHKTALAVRLCRVSAARKNQQNPYAYAMLLPLKAVSIAFAVRTSRIQMWSGPRRRGLRITGTGHFGCAERSTTMSPANRHGGGFKWHPSLRTGSNRPVRKATDPARFGKLAVLSSTLVWLRPSDMT